jgi:hypothetical protein
MKEGGRGRSNKGGRQEAVADGQGMRHGGHGPRPPLDYELAAHNLIFGEAPVARGREGTSI